MRFCWIPLVCSVALAACSGTADEQGNVADTQSPRPAAVPATAGVQPNDPGMVPLPPRGIDAVAFAPSGWKIVRSAKADFDGDGHPDLLLVLRQQDASKIRPLNERTRETLDANPYRIAAALFDPVRRDYRMVAEDHRLISRNEDAGFADPFNDVDVGKGSFTVKLARLANLAGQDAERRSFTFRYQDGAFRLIGLDVVTARPDEGKYTARSVNYLTHRMKVEDGPIGDETVAVTKWRNLPKATLLRLNEVGDGLAFRLPDA